MSGFLLLLRLARLLRVHAVLWLRFSAGDFTASDLLHMSDTAGTECLRQHGRGLCRQRGPRNNDEIHAPRHVLFGAVYAARMMRFARFRMTALPTFLPAVMPRRL